MNAKLSGRDAPIIDKVVVKRSLIIPMLTHRDDKLREQEHKTPTNPTAVAGFTFISAQKPMGKVYRALAYLINRLRSENFHIKNTTCER